MDPNSNGPQFLPHTVPQYMGPNRFAANPPDYGHITGPQSNVYQPPNLRGAGDVPSPSSSNQSFTMSSHPSPALEYPPITPPHLTHSRRGSRESGETSSSNSTSHSGALGSTLVQRHKRGHATASMSPQSPIALRNKVRKVPKKKDQLDDDEDAMSEEDSIMSQKLRREDAKKSRQDAEQKRRDQLKGAYDQLRGVVPGTSEKTSKVQLVTHAKQYIEKLIGEREKLKLHVDDTDKELKSLRKLNERLMEKLSAHGIDFKDDLKATEMELPPEEPEQHDQMPMGTIQPPVPPPVAIIPNNMRQVPSGAMSAPLHRPGHYRSSSNVSASHYPVSAVPETGLPMSAPSHTTALPSYPALPISTPASPLKAGSSMMPPLSVVPSQGANVQQVPQLHLTFPPPMHHVPSPSSSASSTAPQHAFYSPDGQNRVFYSEDTSPSDSLRGSATSSQIGLNMGHMALDERAYLQQRHGSTPQSPSQAMSNFSNQAYQDPSAFHAPDVQFPMNMQAMGNPGLGLHNGTLQGTNGIHADGVMASAQGFGSNGMNGIQIPGAYPHDDAMAFGRQPLQAMGSNSSFVTQPEVVYQGGQVTSSLPVDYGHPGMAFSQDGLTPGHERHLGIDGYSPLVSQQPSPRQGQQQQHQFVASPASQSTPQNSHHLVLSTPGVGQMSSSPQQLDLPHSPLGPLPDGTQNGRTDGGIAPSMLMGGNDSTPIATPAAEADPSNGDVGNTNGADGAWYQPDPSFAQ